MILWMEIDLGKSISDTEEMPRRYSTNQIQNVLDLLGIDWHSPRYGRPRVAGDAATIIIPDNGSLGELISPLVANGAIELEGTMPPARMCADGYEKPRFWQNRALSNLARIQKRISEYIGPPVRSRNLSYYSSQWRDQAGSITLSCWKDGKRPVFDRMSHPDLRYSCRIEIVSGWRRPLSEKDISALDNMAIIGRGSSRGVKFIITAPPSDHDIIYTREPGYEPEKIDAIVGYDRKTRQVIVCPGKLMIIPVARIKSVRHETHEKPRQGFRSFLIATMHDNKEVVLAEHQEQHGLDLVTRGLSRALDLSIARKRILAI